MSLPTLQLVGRVVYFRAARVFEVVVSGQPRLQSRQCRKRQYEIGQMLVLRWQGVFAESQGADGRRRLECRGERAGRRRRVVLAAEKAWRGLTKSMMQVPTWRAR